MANRSWHDFKNLPTQACSKNQPDAAADLVNKVENFNDDKTFRKIHKADKNLEGALRPRTKR